MPELFTRVQPGDLITAEVMNRILAALEGLDGRVTTLEGSGGGGQTLEILSLSPAGAIHLGDELRIIGQNFGDPAHNVVVIDTVLVSSFKAGSGNNLLILDVPAIPGVPAGSTGKQVTLSVSGPNGFDSLTITLLQAVATVPAGTLILNLAQSAPEPLIQVGQSYTFGFRIRAITNLQETYTVAATMPGASAGWQAQLVSPNDSLLTLPAGPAPDGVTRDVQVRVTVPTGATAANLVFSVTSQHNPSGLTNSTGNIAITVGQPPPVASNDIVIRRGQAFAPVTVEAGTVVVPATGVEGAVIFVATLKNAGTYQVEPLVIQSNPSSRWSTRLGLSSPIFTTSGPNNEFTIPVGLTAQSGAAATNLILRVRSQSNAAVGSEISQPIRIGSTGVA